MSDRPLPPFDEPLAVSAPLAEDAAATHCGAGAPSERNCRWYHGTLQYFRLLDLVAAPATHGAFFAQAIQNLDNPSDYRRVLVSGAADYSMAAQMIWGFRDAGVEARLTVTDQCRTPLLLNEWYAGQVGAQVTTAVSDILDFVVAETFDLIGTHCFLGYFDLENRHRLIEVWQRLLRPGGVVFTVNPVRPTAGTAEVGFSAAQAKQFLDRLACHAAQNPDRVEVEADRLRQWGIAYTEYFRSYPVHSREEILELFESHGFKILSLNAGNPAIDRAMAASGPSEREGVDYATIIAQRI